MMTGTQFNMKAKEQQSIYSPLVHKECFGVVRTGMGTATPGLVSLMWVTICRAAYIPEYDHLESIRAQGRIHKQSASDACKVGQAMLLVGEYFLEQIS